MAATALTACRCCIVASFDAAYDVPEFSTTVVAGTLCPSNKNRDSEVRISINEKLLSPAPMSSSITEVVDAVVGAEVEDVMAPVVVVVIDVVDVVDVVAGIVLSVVSNVVAEVLFVQ